MVVYFIAVLNHNKCNAHLYDLDSIALYSFARSLIQFVSTLLPDKRWEGRLCDLYFNSFVQSLIPLKHCRSPGGVCVYKVCSCGKAMRVVQSFTFLIPFFLSSATPLSPTSPLSNPLQSRTLSLSLPSQSQVRVQWHFFHSVLFSSPPPLPNSSGFCEMGAGTFPPPCEL